MIRILFFSMLLLFSTLLNAQRKTALEVSFTGYYKSENISITYNNGLLDSLYEFVPSKTFYLNDTLLAPFGTFNIYYKIDDKTVISSDKFTVSDKLSKMVCSVDSIKKEIFIEQLDSNSINLFDTSSNKQFGRIINYRRTEATAFDDFTKANGFPPYEKKQLKTKFDSLFKNLNGRTLEFLRKNANDYYSFWFFCNQIVPSSYSLLNNDTIYFSYLYRMLIDIFPNRYLNPVYGKQEQLKLKSSYTSLQSNTMSPAFSAIDINGNEISLKKIEGKYILLDFWATWCGPCLAEIPYIKKLRESFSENDLIIIGISKDYSYKSLSSYVEKNNLNWFQIYDKLTYLMFRFYPPYT